MVAQTGYDEIATLLADMDPAKMLSIKSPDSLRERVEFLIDKKREGTLSPEEAVELEHYLIVNRLFALAKIRARQQLSTLIAQ